MGSSSNASASQTLIEHWNGTRWKIEASPNPSGSSLQNYLVGVAATSHTNAWAVGSYNTRRTGRTLALHWNGTAWGP